jgi:hypothetical protein
LAVDRISVNWAGESESALSSNSSRKASNLVRMSIKGEITLRNRPRSIPRPP